MNDIPEGSQIQSETHRSVGQEIDRVDGRLKVTGSARYSAEVQLKYLAHAVIVGSTVARGRVRDIDTSRAERVLGVLAVLTHRNAPKIKPTDVFNPGVGEGPAPAAATSVPPLQNNEVFHYGQQIACVVAETLEQAEHAASLVRVTYNAQTPEADFDKALRAAETPETVWGRPPVETHGDPDRALADAAIKVDAIYTTPFEHHNPMEPHATTALWEGDSLTVYDSSRYVHGAQRMLAEQFGLDPSRVRVISQFIGGSFGSKGAVRPHVPLAAMCARHVGRPVKLVLSRQQMFETTGHRPATRQRVALGATKDGLLVSIIHEGASTCSATDPFVEPFTLQTLHLYASEHRRLKQEIVRLNAPQPTPMRAPGEASGMFALESAMDELAYRLKMDPIALRRINEPPTEPVTGKPFSNRRLLACLEKGALAFDWARRSPVPRSMQDGRFLIGMGVATAVYPLKGNPTSAVCRLLADGSAIVQSGTHDHGNGVATIMRQIAADALGVRIEKVRFEYGDTQMPFAPITGGSTTAMWVGTAVQIACDRVRTRVLDLTRLAEDSPLKGAANEAVAYASGRLYLKDDPTKGETYQAILSRSGESVIEATAEAKPSEEQKKRFAMDSYGAHFCEVAVNPDSGEVHIRRYLGVFNCGRILNPKLARSQFVGSIAMGIGMALMERTVLDPRNGRWVNPDLGEYYVPVAADVPEVEVSWLDDPDEQVNPLGAKGIGEIGIVGVAAVIANAVYHATGVRVRELPITPDKLL